MLKSLATALSSCRLECRYQAQRYISAETRLAHIGNQGRSRIQWTQEDTDLLLKAYKEHGPAYSYITKTYFPTRPVVTIFNRCKLLFDNSLYRGPFEQDEISKLTELTKGIIDENQIDWVAIQQQMPKPRPLPLLRNHWFHSINPRFNRGRWTDEEKLKFDKIMDTVGGSGNWEQISALMGSRTPRQCLERFRWQLVPTVKGTFSKHEDELMLKVIAHLGDKDFLKIKQAMNSPRSARHLSQHYRYKLDPQYDRSPWTQSEEDRLVSLYHELGDMTKVRNTMASKRHPKDMWNRYHCATLRQRSAKRRKATREAGHTISSTG
ncbi:hypothetical protein DM01DRAFT_1340575 [Hesseltinella vesiculosa]|uniref:Homeodomain-like protein n=1 Tax=Hesseltinella vesiculosa TaxID=101127 RepID=A0A1X2G3Q1_9FUNG|nr:hypothetical protein DM01DRAFT_1340575 [Hesseltinella vesiculosa]